MRSKHFMTAVVLLLLMLLSLGGCQQQDVPEPPQPQAHKTPSEVKPAPLPPSQPTSPDSSSQAPAAPAVKAYSWYFTRNGQHQVPAANPETRELLAANQAFYVLPQNDSKIYLTFDAGYELGYTSRILDTLKANQVNAAFFITGHYLHTQPELVKRMKAEGNLVCNHTLNHPDCARISREKLEEEITSLQQQYLQVTGQEIDRYLRPPMGNYSELSLKTTSDLGYKTVFWSIAFNDWDPAKQPGADYAYQHVLDNIHPGAVILLHAVSQSDTEALDRIIKDLKSQGYVFATFDQ